MSDDKLSETGRLLKQLSSLRKLVVLQAFYLFNPGSYLLVYQAISSITFQEPSWYFQVN